MKELKEFYIDLTVYPKAVRLAWLAEIEPLLRKSAGCTVYNDNDRSIVGYIYSYGNGGYGWDDTEGGSAYGHGEQFAPGQAIAYFKGLKEEVKVGDWVVNHNPDGNGWNTNRKSEVFRVAEVRGYGVQVENACCLCNGEFRLATKEEIKSHLIAEARRRGFWVQGTLRYKPLDVDYVQDWGHVEDVDAFDYRADDDVLLYNMCCIYDQGVWAEIVEKGIEINKYEKAISDIEKILEVLK